MVGKLNKSMKSNQIFIFVFLFFICIACKTDKTDIQEENTIYVYVGFTETELPLLKESTILRKVFDDVINTNQYNHPYLMRQLTYSMSIRELENYIEISIELRKNGILYCEKIKGIFLYKNQVFVYTSDLQSQTLFFNTGKTCPFKCRDNDILMYDINDEMYGVWEYHLYDSTIVKQKVLRY